ncbi:MAG: hypothetical protein RL347_1388 [Actinomycetota bacterium]|jgi:uncharacterized membrane protein YeiH
MSAVDVPNIAANTPLWLALLTTFVAAVSGAILGRQPGRVSYDIVGVTVFAFVLGLGGGITRDVLLGNLPPLALRSPWYVVTVLGAVVAVMLVGRWISVDSWTFILLDALALALYAVIAAQLAVEFGLPDIGAITVGFLAAITGGVVVSLMRGETPQILLPSQPYALLAVVGATIYVLLDQFSGGVAALACLISVIVLRFVTLKWNLKTSSVKPLPEPKSGEAPAD